MRQFQNFGDARNQGFCVHCGGADATADHVPSKALLDRPLPDNLPVAPACLPCNNGFSADEEYLACLIECVISGTTDPSGLTRPTVARALEQNRKLQQSIQAGRRETDGGLVWDFDAARVRRIILKQARGHIAYELNEPQLGEPDRIWCRPLSTMTPEQRELFENDGVQPGALAGWPEVGTRAMQRLLIADEGVVEEGWVVVQEGRYRYRADQDDGWRVRMVLSEYLACEVAWD